MSKPTLLAWSDYLCPTGFGNVAEQLYRDLHLDFDLNVVAINYRGNKEYDKTKHIVFPTTEEDPLGFKILVNKAKEIQPDIIFLFQDIFNMNYIIKTLKEDCPDSKIVIYFPVDGRPLSVSWYNVLVYADYIFTYTDWANKVINETYVVDKPLTKLYHGVDTDIFYPLDSDDVLELKSNENWDGKFVVCNVNRFQPRKNVTSSIRAWSMFTKGFKYCTQDGHHMPLNAQRCELCRNTKLKTTIHSKEDVMLYLHMMPYEMTMGQGHGNALQNHMINAGFVNEDVNHIIDVNAKNIYKGEVPIERVNEIYNIANVNITSSSGEGCGLSLLESAAAGTPSIAPNHSAIPEMLNGTGWLVKNKTVYSQAHDNGFVRPLVDEWDMVKNLEKAYKDWKKSGQELTKNQDCIDNIQQNFLWDDKRGLLKKSFGEALKG